jgi:ATP synthase protein I
MSTAPASRRRSAVPVPPSGHRDAQWYRRAATKASAAEPDTRLVACASDDAAWSVVSHIAAGILLYGGLGWLLGTWWGHRPLFVAGGVLVGVSLALFMLFRKLESLGREPETPREDPS